MILSSFDFQRTVDFGLYFCNKIDTFEETHFFILSRLGFIFDGFCARSLELPALRGWVGS